jgi:hypothetical protein
MSEFRNPVHRVVYRRFERALLDFSDEPTPLNALRYVTASRALDRVSAESARSGVKPGGGARPSLAA